MDNGSLHPSNNCSEAEFTNAVSSLSTDEAVAFKAFVDECERTGLLDWPAGLDKDELKAGINDLSTLLCVIFFLLSLVRL